MGNPVCRPLAAVTLVLESTCSAFAPVCTAGVPELLLIGKVRRMVRRPVQACGTFCCNILLQETLLAFSSSEQLTTASVDAFTQFYSDHFYIYR
jgi:hypothetical protein